MNAVLKPMLSDPHVEPHRGQRVASSTGARNLERGRGSLSLFTNDDSGAALRQSTGGVSYVVQFPGGPSTLPPRPPRLMGDVAEAAAQRNVGVMANLLDTNANRDYVSPRPQPKLRSTEAKDIAAKYAGNTTSFCLNHERNQGYSSAREPCVRGAVGREALDRSRGVVGSILAMDENMGYVSPRHKSRLTGSEAESNARQFNGTGARLAMDIGSNVGYQSARPPSRTISAAAQNNAARCNGIAMSRLISSDSSSSTPRPQARVRPEARDAAERSRGTCGLAMEGRLPGEPVCEVRVKGSGKDNYERGRQGTVNNLLSQYGSQPVSGRPPTRTRGDAGSEISQTGQAGTVHQLFHSYGQLPRSARSEPRVRPEAKQNAIRNMGTMSDFL